MLVNGVKQREIAILDRAVQYGDGCFTTIAYRNGCLEFFNEHIQRLKKACRVLFIEFHMWPDLVKHIGQSVESLSAKNEECVIKVIISRGEGGRGYSPQGASNPTFIISHHSFPSHYVSWQVSGIRLTVSPITLAQQPLYEGVKHLNRLEQVLVKAALQNTSFDDAVVCDTAGKVVETSVGNIFWKSKKGWCTSDLTKSGVDGVMRNQVLAIMKNKGWGINVVSANIGELFKAQELFVCNSLMGLVPVTHLEDPHTQKVKKFDVEDVKHFQDWISILNYAETPST